MKMEEPETKNLRKLAVRLFAEQERQDRFIAALRTGDAARPAILWLGERPQKPPFVPNDPASWQPAFVDGVKSENKAGAHPLHEEGAYYCLDLSSVFQIAVTSGVPVPPRIVLDVCASPGGKSVFMWRQWKPEQLVCNEVIGKRLGALIANLNRCKVPATVVNSDVNRLSEAWTETFDFVLADAPCSGQSLVARRMRAPACFHPATINMNSNRQKRIAAHSGALVRPGGHLAYTTCTYSIEENEGVLEWMLKKFPEFQPVEVSGLEQYRSTYSKHPCYRLWPEQGEGAGGFSVLLKKTGSAAARELDLTRVRIVNQVRP